jgi:hypothetical protein
MNAGIPGPWVCRCKDCEAIREEKRRRLQELDTPPDKSGEVNISGPLPIIPSCHCCEQGSDGTWNHSQTIATGTWKNRHFVICSNHLENYERSEKNWNIQKIQALWERSGK